VFAGDGWLLPQILRGLPDAADFYLDSLTQVRLDSWSSGRVALVGDAGYSPSPLTGLGTCLSLVGAYVLAGELAAAGGDHRVAFARYDELLRPYVKQCQELPPGGVNGFLPSGRGAIAMRAMTMRAMTRWPLRGLMARAFTKADAIDLPTYPVPAAK
jgi:2-polyprenyl-6-methoxyphenol hydroxylase-like FAD-dependent oxidoreductase